MIFGQQDHFFSLVDALSAMRVLSRMPIEGVAEEMLLNHALNALLEYQDLEQCSIFLLEGQTLHCAVGGGVSSFRQGESERPSGAAKPMQFQVGEGIMGLACQSRKIQYCRNCKDDPRFKPFQDRTLFYGDGSLLSIPILSEETVLGVLNVSHHLPEFFETWHQHFLVMFAHSLGRLLYLHRLVTRLSDEVAARTQALEASARLQDRYKQLSVRDDLTGLFNRRYFFAEGESLLTRAIGSRQPLSILRLDVDHFKLVNDRWGHKIGDQLLYQIAQTLIQLSGEGDLAARLDGDEFILMLPGRNGEAVEGLAGEIQTQVAALDAGIEGEPIELTVCIGMVTLPVSSQPEFNGGLDYLYQEAGHALEQGKRSGRAYCLHYVPLSGGV